MKITPLYYLSIAITFLILVVSMFTFYHQYCYLTNNTFERIMRVEKSVYSSNSKRKSNTIEGKIKLKTKPQRIVIDPYLMNIDTFIKDNEKEID